MEFITGAYTDVGIKKSKNQDSHSITVANTPYGKIAFAVICDGMGGLAKGEVASSYVVGLFDRWLRTDLPNVLKNGSMQDLEYQWNEIVQSANIKIAEYSKQFGINMGTTLTAVLLHNNKGYAVHVGDTRLYQITDSSLEILTEDQTLVAREVRRGNMTPEQAEADPRRNVLLQCIGASRVVVPQFLQFDFDINQTYMMCSDGFRHKVSEQEIHKAFSPSVISDKQVVIDNSKALVELNKSRMETDNITVLTIKTY